MANVHQAKHAMEQLNGRTPPGQPRHDACPLVVKFAYHKESPWEGMGNGKQRGRAWERETKGEGTGMGNKESPWEGMGNGKQRGRAWATGNKGGGHGNGKQRGPSPHHRKALGWFLVATLYWLLRRRRMESHMEKIFGRFVMFMVLLRGFATLWLCHNLSGATAIKRGSHGRGNRGLVRA